MACQRSCSGPSSFFPPTQATKLEKPSPRKGSHTSHSGFCSATSIAQAPHPEPHSKILRGRGIGGKINLLSNIMLKIPCMYWRWSISSYPPANIGETKNQKQAEHRLHRPQERSKSRSPPHIAETPCCRGQRPPDMCCRRGQFGNRYIRLSDFLRTAAASSKPNRSITHSSVMVVANSFRLPCSCDAANVGKRA